MFLFLTKEAQEERAEEEENERKKEKMKEKQKGMNVGTVCYYFLLQLWLELIISHFTLLTCFSSFWTDKIFMPSCFVFSHLLFLSRLSFHWSIIYLFPRSFLAYLFIYLFSACLQLLVLLDWRWLPFIFYYICFKGIYSGILWLDTKYKLKGQKIQVPIYPQLSRIAFLN